MTTATRSVALIVGEGPPTAVVPHVLRVLEAAGASFYWHRVDVPRPSRLQDPSLLDEAVAAVETCGVALKTRLPGPVKDAGQPGDLLRGPINPNVELRQRLGLFAAVRPLRTFPGLPTRYPDLDLILVRENTEDIYKGIEHRITPDVVQSLKVVTKSACARIARFAFGLAREEERSSVTFIHKANIMKRSDGLFLDVVRQVAAEYAEIELRDSIVDAACMQLVLDPYRFDVILTGNLYGDILSSLGYGLAGGISAGLSINIGERCRMFEAVHGEPRRRVSDEYANPLPLLRPAVAMLRYFALGDVADRIAMAASRVLRAGKATTPDLGGQASTEAMCAALVDELG